MLHYLSKRALSSLIALFLFVSLMFFVTEIVIPGDFTTQFALVLNPQQRAELQHELGLDIPLGQRYLNWLRNLLHGDLGASLYGPAVLDLLKEALPYTLLIFFLGTVIAFQLGQKLGRLTAWPTKSKYPLLATIRKYLSGGVTLGAVLFYTTFPPWLAFLVAQLASRRLSLKRDFRGRTIDPSKQIFTTAVWQKTGVTPSMVMVRIVLSFVVIWLVLNWVSGLIRKKYHWQPPVWLQVFAFTALLVGSWYAFGFGQCALELMTVAATPLVTYILLSFGETLLITRTSLLDTLQEDFITTARAKGAPEATVRDRHAARTALFPVLSRFMVSFPYMLTSTVILEDVLGWPGISNTLFDSLYQKDMAVVMGALLLVGAVSAAARLALDILYALLDPRIRYDRGQIRRAA
ncbi:MAG: ABC transporter permease [Anaerolineae bacterium]|nr:ABC transporter permease [Anaerolineae bacterium]